jgi:hypothetical protein
MTTYNNLYIEQQAVTSMRGWMQRLRAKGIEPNADEVHGRIKEKWPQLNDEQIERIQNDGKIA